MDGETPIVGAPSVNACVYRSGGSDGTRTANVAIAHPGVTIDASVDGADVYITLFSGDTITPEIVTDPVDPVTIPDGTWLVTVTYNS